MTIYSKRRGKRSLAAILAAMLVASALVVVAGSPAQAANTSAEALFDRDRDPSTDKVREFGGIDRYDTALRLAKHYGNQRGGQGTVPVAFVASGTSMIDAVAVAGLAGELGGPVLLTESDELHGGVEDWIEDYGAGTIYVLGGSAAISDAVVDDLEGMVHQPTVKRIAGADRYATAAAIAAELASLNSEATWCGSDQRSAVIVNGTEGLLNAVMAGPMIARQSLPVLLTEADALPDVTADFIDENDIDQVVIVGGTDSVSAGVATALQRVGASTVTRIAKGSAAATSVALTELARSDCRDALGDVSTGTVALLRGDKLVDGIAAAPMLADAYKAGSMVPVLVVGESLPASVHDWLATTPDENTAGIKQHLDIVAIGGHSAVSDSVMQAALAAAASADPLTVAIAASTDTDGDGTPDPLKPGLESFTLYFSDDVLADSGAATPLTDFVRDSLRINNVTPDYAETGAITHAGRTVAGGCKPGHVVVTLASPLAANDIISLEADKATIGAGTDLRPVVSEPVTVKQPAPDRTGPKIDIIMIVGQNTAHVTVTEAMPGGDNDEPAFQLNHIAPDPSDAEADKDSEVTVTVGGQKVAASAITDLAQQGGATSSRWTTVITLSTSGQVFGNGDKITVTKNALTDNADNGISGTRTFYARTSNARQNPSLSSVLMSQQFHSAQAMWSVPEAIDGDADDSDGGGIRIAAKKGGPADGAAGNDWTIGFDRHSDHDPDKPVDIKVSVSTKVSDPRAIVTFRNGTPTFGELKAKLDGHKMFAERFTVNLPPADATAPCGARQEVTKIDVEAFAERRLDAGLADSDRGMTKVNIRAVFDGYVATVDADVLLADIFAAADKRHDGADVAAAISTAGLDAATDVAADTIDAANAPAKMVTWTAVTADLSSLPRDRDLVRVGADIAAGYIKPETDGTVVTNKPSGISPKRVTVTSSVPAPKM